MNELAPIIQLLERFKDEKEIDQLQNFQKKKYFCAKFIPEIVKNLFYYK